MEPTIRPPEARHLPRATRRLLCAAAALTVCVLAATAVVDASRPAPKPILVGAERDAALEAQRSRDVRDGSAMRWLEQEWRQRSRVRRTVAPTWSALLLKYAGAAPRDLVVGADGWLFYRERAQPAGLDRTAAIERTARVLAAVQRRLASSGTRFFALPIPRKAQSAPETFPPDVDCDRGFEGDLVAALRAAGVETIDLRSAFAALPVEERYLRLDAHWAPEGVAAAARAVAEALPAALRGDREVTVAPSTAPPLQDLLPFASIPWGHPARKLFRPDPPKGWRLGPPEFAAAAATALYVDERGFVRGRPTAEVLASPVALTGSSFSLGFGVAERLAYELRRPVRSSAQAGRSLLFPLGVFAEEFEGGPLPPFVVHEFPVHLAFALGRDGDPSPASLGTLLAEVAPRTERLAAAPPIEVLAPRAAPGVRALVPAEHVAATGDGVVSLFIEVDSGSATRWRLESGGAPLEFTLPGGGRSATLPVLGSDRAEPRLIALDSAAAAAALSAVLHTDVDLDAAPARALEREAGRAWSLEFEERRVGPFDALAIEGAGAPERLTVTFAGRDARGTAVQGAHSFDRPRRPPVLVGLTALRGGVLESVRVEVEPADGPASVRVRIAPQLVRERD